MNAERNKAIGTVIQGLHGLLKEYRDEKYSCPKQESLSFQCGSFLLGALTKRLDQLNVLAPQPESPFLGLDFYSLEEKLEDISTPVWFSLSTVTTYYSSQPDYVRHDCKLQNAIDSLTNGASKNIDGLVVNEK